MLAAKYVLLAKLGIMNPVIVAIFAYGLLHFASNQGVTIRADAQSSWRSKFRIVTGRLSRALEKIYAS